MEALVTTDWLANNLAAPDIRIADATWFLPEHNRDARTEFEQRHIPGAVFLDLDSFADKASKLPSMLPPPEQLASRMQALGLGDGCRIVLYDDSPGHSSARAWWMLTAFGTPDVAILDGGLAKWIAEGRLLESGPAAPRPRHFTVRQRPESVRDLAQMRALHDSHAEQIVDARSPSRFAGREPEPRPGVEPGHIPGSTNLPYGEFFHPDGTWKRDITLRAVFESEGIEIGKPIVATCGSGITASVIAFGAHLLGHNASVYDGSWAEWGGNPSTPKAKGAA